MTCLEHITGSTKCMQLVFRFLNNLVPGMSTNQILLHLLLTSTYCVHSNVYGLINTCCIRYHTPVDSIYSTSSANHTYQTRTCVSISVEVPDKTSSIDIKVGNCSPIGEEPVSSGRIPATCYVVSFTEQGKSITITNVLQGHKTVVLVCCSSEWEPDTWKEDIPLL